MIQSLNVSIPTIQSLNDSIPGFNPNDPKSLSRADTLPLVIE